MVKHKLYETIVNTIEFKQKTENVEFFPKILANLPQYFHQKKGFISIFVRGFFFYFLVFYFCILRTDGVLYEGELMVEFLKKKYDNWMDNARASLSAILWL